MRFSDSKSKSAMSLASALEVSVLSQPIQTIGGFKVVVC